MPHPQELINFKNYRMKEFLPNIEVIEDEEAIKIIELLWALEVTSEIMIDYEMYERSLPLLTLMDYICTDIIKSIPNVIKARILKCIACWKLGYIHESLQLYFSVIKNKDKVVESKNFLKIFTIKNRYFSSKWIIKTGLWIFIWIYRVKIYL